MTHNQYGYSAVYNPHNIPFLNECHPLPPPAVLCHHCEKPLKPLGSDNCYLTFHFEGTPIVWLLTIKPGDVVFCSDECTGNWIKTHFWESKQNPPKILVEKEKKPMNRKERKRLEAEKHDQEIMKRGYCGNSDCTERPCTNVFHYVTGD
jgi:hypothetical protein